MTHPIGSQISAMEKAAKQELFDGIDKDTKFSISLPRSHNGQFSSIEQLDFVIQTGKYKNSNASAIVAKVHSSQIWHVLDVYVQQGELWLKIPKLSKNTRQH